LPMFMMASISFAGPFDLQIFIYIFSSI
jgi:hypothetical protein